MKLAEERRIEAPRDKVYAALNDPEILRQAIPGCESLTKKSDTEMTATVKLKIGPVAASFEGEVTLSDLVPPESYTISGSGTGGAAGVASGKAKVSLKEEEGATVLRYDVEAEVGGKIAQLGSRLIDSTARKLAGQFFTRFGELVEGKAPAAAEAAEPDKGGIPTWVWFAAAGAALAAALLLLR